MKKLMTIAAVALCGAAMADAVESSNIVGYQELDTDATGKKMVVPTFVKTEGGGQWSLADLKVAGYTAPSKNAKGKWVNGCQAFEFIVEKLTTAGTRDVAYHWLDNGTVGPGWFADETGTAIEGGAENIKFDAGTGFWTAGSAYKLVPAGAVNAKDIEFATDVAGKVAIGNASPVDLTLADLTVIGYTAPSKNAKGKWVGGCQAFEFIVEKLTTAGTRDVAYHWLDNGTVGPGWFADETGTAIVGGAEKVTISAGQGLWTAGSGYKLVIPAPEL